ncbi:hypothetical protein EJ02DRAFT_466516 [Clathrospora elynae]|uniref:Uncharacterized protein n=1 Tax=Clathrospora elynae TaxID=706981 RepID=A0A6A5SN59_9PLEO|nr:hypothetical protein EJ02DRAFT_466516 [Clathrospora elynae]
MGFIKRFSNRSAPTRSNDSNSVFSMLKSRTYPVAQFKISPEVFPEQTPTPPAIAVEKMSFRLLRRSHTFPVSKKQPEAAPEIIERKILVTIEEYETMPMARKEAALERVNTSRAYLSLPEKNLDKSLRSPRIRPVSLITINDEASKTGATPSPHDSCVSESERPCYYDIFPVPFPQESLGWAVRRKVGTCFPRHVPDVEATIPRVDSLCRWESGKSVQDDLVASVNTFLKLCLLLRNTLSHHSSTTQHDFDSLPIQATAKYRLFINPAQLCSAITRATELAKSETYLEVIHKQKEAAEARMEESHGQIEQMMAQLEDTINWSSKNEFSTQSSNGVALVGIPTFSRMIYADSEHASDASNTTLHLCNCPPRHEEYAEVGSVGQPDNRVIRPWSR